MKKYNDVIITQDSNVELIKTEALKESQPLVTQAKSLQITDEVSYQKADTIRSKLKAAKKAWTERLKVIIRPAYETLEGLYELQREVVNPIDASDTIITGKMKEYKRLDEAEGIAKAIREREEAERKLEEEKAEQQRKIDAAKNKAVANLAQKKLEKIEEKIEEVKQKVYVPIKAQNSGTRTVMKWRVKDFKRFLKAVAEGYVPEDVIQINEPSFNEYFRADDHTKTAIRTWPGIEIYEDIQIVSKR